jgi:hypothetical protein
MESVMAKRANLHDMCTGNVSVLKIGSPPPGRK